MSKKYEIYSGRRMVSIQYSVTPLQAAVDYARRFGSADDEIRRIGGLRHLAGRLITAVPHPELGPAA